MGQGMALIEKRGAQATMDHVVIIGNGVAGITTARHIRKHSDLPITVISSETKFYYSRTALMYVYMGHMEAEQLKPYEDWFWKKNRIDLIQDYADRIDFGARLVHLKNTPPIRYTKLVLATGSRPNFFGWPGQDLAGVQGLYSWQDLERMETNTRNIRKAVIVGGGLIGIEMAEMLCTRDIDVTFLVREGHYWGNILRKEEGELVGRHMAQHHVDLRVSDELKEIIPNDQGRVKEVTTKTGDTIPCDFVGITAGVHPNVDFLKGGPLNIDRGILVNSYLETNIPDVYACGDCAQIEDSEGNRRLEQLWYTGRMQGETLAQTLTGTRTAYDRGIWFNSAKFFDIEYHTYGYLPAKPGPEEDNIYWEHPEGRHCFRLSFEKGEGPIIGMNSFGIRYRHKQFETWIREKRDVRYVLAHLGEANFDPEFYSSFESEILKTFNRKTKGEALQPPRKKFLGLF